MDVKALIAYLEGHLSSPPVWNAEAPDQDKEFNKWKVWSARMSFVSKIANSYKNEENREKAAVKAKS